MRVVEKLLWLMPLVIVVWTACRPALPPSPPPEGVAEKAPAQALTPTPTPTSATPTPAPTRAIIRTPGPGFGPEPRPKLTEADLSVPTPPPFPDMKLTEFPLPKSKEEAIAQLNQRLQELGLKPGIVQETSGPSTMGGDILLAGKVIKLPDDAYIEDWIVSITCGKGPCPKAPIYSIVRGKSKIVFSSVDGEVINDKTAAGEEAAFDFLRSYLKRKP